MAMVFEAFDQNLSRDVAVKILKPELSQSAKKQQQFLQEATIMARLEFPGIVPIYEMGQTPEGESFYSMKKVQGRTLKQLIDMRKPEEVFSRHYQLRLLGIFERVSQAVAHAHSQGIVHLDIKPSNIMLDDFGDVFLMDWGIAKEVKATQTEGGALDDELTSVNIVEGSPAYMAPEQVIGSRANDFKADVFMLGIVLYEILTGQRPFAGGSPRQTLDEVLFHEPPPPRSVNKAVSRELSSICMKALRKDPRARYSSAQQITNDLQNFRELRPVSTVKPNFYDIVSKWGKRHSALASILSAIFIFGLLAITSVSALKYFDHLRLKIAGERLAMHNEESAAMHQKLRELRLAEQKPSPNKKERVDVKLRIENVQKEILMKHVEIRRVLSFIFGLTNYQVDDWILSEARKEQFFSLNYTYSELKDYALVRYVVQDAVNRYHSGNLTKFSKGEFQRILQYGKDAEAMLQKRRGELERSELP